MAKAKADRFDDIFSAAQHSPDSGANQTEPASSPTEKPSNPWDALTPPEKEATKRLNVDIPLSLDDLLSEKARQLRKPKTELVRRLLEWALIQ